MTGHNPEHMQYNGDAMNGKLITIALGILLTQGEPALAAALTVPRPLVEKSCKATGADVEKAVEERNEAAQAMTQLVISLAHGVTHDGPDAAEARDSLGIKSVNKNAAKLATDNVANLVTIAFMFYRVFGADAARRMLTVPRNALVAVCNVTGADLGEAVAMRDHATEELLEFFESLADANFTDPD